MRRGDSLAAALLAVAVASGCATATRPVPVAEAEPAFASPEEKLLYEAHRHALQHRPKDAIATVDRILATYGDPERPEGARRSYCARSMEETVYYMVLAQSRGEEAVALDPTWAEAYYLKGYALVELGRLDEARRAIAKALVLSPKNSKYHSEIGHTWQAERKWSEALDSFTKAADAARFSPAESRVEEKTRALRGQGFALVELGRLAEAEAKYREALAVDRGDFRSREELGYVERLRKKEGI